MREPGIFLTTMGIAATLTDVRGGWVLILVRIYTSSGFIGTIIPCNLFKLSVPHVFHTKTKLCADLSQHGNTHWTRLFSSLSKKKSEGTITHSSLHTSVVGNRVRKELRAAPTTLAKVHIIFIHIIIFSSMGMADHTRIACGPHAARGP